MDYSNYWDEKMEIPPLAKQKIAGMVKGKPIDTIRINGEAKALLRADGNVFKCVFDENRQYLYRGNFTASSDENDYDTSLNYLSQDGLAGFSVSGSGWLTSLYSNYPIGSGFIRAVKRHVIADAYKLVCIVTGTEKDNRLIELYKTAFGFIEYARTVDDTKPMRFYYGDIFIERFIKANGNPFHVFMIGKNTAHPSGDTIVFDDYFAAEDYVNKTVHRCKY